MSRGQGRVFRPKVKRADGQRRETSIWWLDYSIRGERFYESSGTKSKGEAQRILRDRLGGRETGKLVGRPDRLTFEDLRALVERQYELDGRRSLSRIQIAFNHLAGFFAGTRAVEISPDRADAYAVHRLAQGAARATINRELAGLRRGFRLALKKGLLTTRPEFSIPAEHNARTGFFEPDDFAAVLAELPNYLKPVARFMYLTGWRTKKEVLPLTWAQVDFDAGVIRLEVGSTKSRAGRVFPFTMLPELEQLLRAQRAAAASLFVFHRNGQRIRDFYAAWHSACRRASVQTCGNGLETVVRPQLVGRIPHDFRRTAVRNLVRAGVPERVAMQLTGHKTRAIFDRYNIVNEQDLTDGVAKLARFHGNGKHPGNNPPAAEPGPRVSSGAA